MPTKLLRLTLCLAVPIAAWVPTASATDGVAEINQACALVGCFPGDAAGFPVTIGGAVSSRSFRLTSPLVLPDASVSGIDIQQPNVEIDLNGFGIVSSGCVGATTDCTPPNDIGVGVITLSSARRGIVVRDGYVIGMGFNAINLGANAEVRNVRARWNALGGIAVFGDSVVSDCVVDGNGGTGINSVGGARIVGNSVSDNTGVGILASSDAHVAGNRVFSNQGDGIDVGARSQVTENSVVSNGGDGIETDSNSAIRNNTVSGNSGTGIRATSGGSDIVGNTIRDNGGNGVDCSDGGTSDVRDNSIVENTGIGIELVDPIRPDAVFRDNVIYDNDGGTVTGGATLNRGGNTCRNFSGFTDCP